MTEFTPFDRFSKLINFWWVIALAAILGGAGGYLFYHLHPPLYEAASIFYVSIDVNQMAKMQTPEAYQYNEDLGVEALKAVLVSDEVTQAVIQKAAGQNIHIDALALQKNGTIERQHGLWELRYRSEDPAAAQAVTNLWAEQGYETMLKWKSANRIAVYVKIEPPTTAPLPDTPVAFRLNYLMLSGALLGFIASAVVSDLWLKKASR